MSHIVCEPMQNKCPRNSIACFFFDAVSRKPQSMCTCKGSLIAHITCYWQTSIEFQLVVCFHHLVILSLFSCHDGLPKSPCFIKGQVRTRWTYSHWDQRIFAQDSSDPYQLSFSFWGFPRKRPWPASVSSNSFKVHDNNERIISGQLSIHAAD